MKGKRFKKIFTCAAALIMALSVTACGGNGGKNGADFVYVPEFMEIEDDNISYNVQYADNCLYYESYSWDEQEGYKSSIVKYSLLDGSTATVPLEFDGSVNMNAFKVGQDGSVYAYMEDYSEDRMNPEGYYDPKRTLCRYDENGQLTFSYDMTDLWQTAASDGYGLYVQRMAVDKGGRVYLATSNNVWLFDEECNYWGTAETGTDWISDMGTGKDGKVYVCYYNSNPDSNGYILAEIDYEGKALGATYENFISSGNSGLTPGAEYDFLCSDGSSLYGYNLKSQENEKLLDWLDSDVNGTYINCIGQLEDGRIFAVINDWSSNDNSIALLTKTKASEVPQKETIVIGTMSGGYELQAAAVKFNKSNDQYHISIKEYIDYNNWNENSWADALTNLNNDLTSNNCPDIIDLNGLNMEQMAAKGVLEDLTPYLENSSLSKDSFVQSVLEAYTYNGALVSIPASFEIRTVIGRGSDVGYVAGWTMDDMIAYADKHPNAQLFDYSDKSSILQMCLMFNESAFIDWSAGECKFDTSEFKSLLEFVNRFPNEFRYEDNIASTPTKIQKGEILLEAGYIYNFDEIQMYNEMFSGDMVCIGFPTIDGSSGTALTADQAYAIVSKSKMKDGAWEFIESYLSGSDENDRFRWGFPNNKEKLAAMAKKAVEIEYVRDENGDFLLDENGEPIPMNVGSSIGYEDGWSYSYRTATQEEVDLVLDLIETAKPVYRSNDEIINIINEEAEAFYQGQKSVDDVVNIIQSRINIYVNENS